MNQLVHQLPLSAIAEAPVNLPLAEQEISGEVLVEKYANVHCEMCVAPPRMMKENASGRKRERSSNDMAVAPRSPT